MKKLLKFTITGLVLALIAITTYAFGFESGAMMAGATVVATQLKNTLAEKEMITNLRHDHTWVSEIRSRPNWVNQDTIKIPKRGEAPRVLIDNTNYPIVSNKRDDSHVVISLNKFDTENTTVTADELYAMPYEKVSDVQLQHRETLEDTTAEYGLWGLAPQEADDTENLFVLETTGEDDGTGRKMLTSADLRTLQTKMNKAGINRKGRVLILSDDHVSDLLDEDRKFYTQYQNHTEGVISKNYYGFIVYEDSTTPLYKKEVDAWEKLPYGSVDEGVVSSVVFHKGSTAKAAGSVTRFARSASEDPENRENTLGFRLYHIIVAYGVEGSAAIVSGTV